MSNIILYLDLPNKTVAETEKNKQRKLK